MKLAINALRWYCSLLILTLQVSAGSQFTSHVSVSTPARSYSHGVGDPIPFHHHRQTGPSFRSLRRQPTRLSGGGRGYPRVRPAIPFNDEDIPQESHDNTLGVTSWELDNIMEVNIPLLPPSPYKVDSPDPESLWPEGLFVPPLYPPRFPVDRLGPPHQVSEQEPFDPYLLDNGPAIAAVKRANRHGFLYFHDIPHIESLLANQELRIKNKLIPHRIASIRHTWPYNRP